MNRIFCIKMGSSRKRDEICKKYVQQVVDVMVANGHLAED